MERVPWKFSKWSPATIFDPCQDTLFKKSAYCRYRCCALVRQVNPINPLSRAGSAKFPVDVSERTEASPGSRAGSISRATQFHVLYLACRGVHVYVFVFPK